MSTDQYRGPQASLFSAALSLRTVRSVHAEPQDVNAALVRLGRPGSSERLEVSLDYCRAE
jgi:hypothetical protein